MASTTTSSTQIQGLIQLTRWKEYIGFTVPLTVLGALMAVQQEGAGLDWRLVAVTLATFLVVAYAFIINDIEDAPDDALEESRRQRNPVSAGRVSLRVGYIALAVVALVTLGLYALGGSYAFLIGVVTLIISHLYSWRKVRLKAWPITDIVSHSLMLSGLLFLAGYFTYLRARAAASDAHAGVQPGDRQAHPERCLPAAYWPRDPRRGRWRQRAAPFPTAAARRKGRVDGNPDLSPAWSPGRGAADDRF